MAVDRVGFIGTGAMGGGMSMRLLEAGHRLVVCDKNPEATKPLRARGAAIASSPREVADAAEIVFACLPSPETSEAVALGENGVVKGGAVRVYVETSTIGTDVIAVLDEGLRDAGIGLLDAPISGGADGARAGTLSTIAAGERALFDRARPMLAAFATHIFYVGDRAGQAQLAKLINNLLSTAAKLVTFEGIALGLAAGLDPDTLVDFINVSTGRNMATLEEFPNRVLRVFQSKGPDAKSIGVKDTELFLREAERFGVPTSLAPKILEVMIETGSYDDRASPGRLLSSYVQRLKELEARRTAKR